MRAPGQRRRELRLQQRAFRDAHVDEVVKTVVEDDLRVDHVDREGAEEHLEHVLVEEEVHRALCLGVGALEIEDGHVPFSPQFAGDLVGPHAHAVVAQVVLELPRLLRNEHLDDVLHGVVVALQHDVHGAGEHLVTEALGDVRNAPRGGLAGGHQRVEVETVPLRRAHVVQDQLEDVLLQHALLVQFGGRDADAFLVDRGRLDGDGARHHATVVGHVSEHGRPGDVAAVLEDRHQHDPVRQVRHGRVAHVRIVGEDDVALLEFIVVDRHERPDEGPELADDHLAVAVGNHREAVALLADTRRHGGAKQHRVHLHPGILQRVLDQVDGNAVHLDLLQRRVIGLDNTYGHEALLMPGG